VIEAPPPVPPAEFRDLAAIQARIRQGASADDPVVRGYLDLVDRGVASAAQLNDFAILLGRRGYYPAAVQYQRVAVRLQSTNPTYWVNLGTLQRSIGDQSAAGSAFKRALTFDPNHARAHYYLGTVYESQGKYDSAVEEYRVALTLDPRLGDPKYNPEVVRNDRMLVVRLLNYAGQSAAMALPVLPATPGAPAQPTAAPATPPATAKPPAKPPAAASPATPAKANPPQASAQRRRAAEQAEGKTR
jgi:tetratricopeptide (TPR) repeat protein